MNTWFSNQFPDNFSLSNNRSILFPELPENPQRPIIKTPQANPPILFLPQSSQLNL